MNTPENSPDNTPKNEQCSDLTLDQLAESIKSQYGVVKSQDKESIKLGRTTVQAAVRCGEYGIKAKAHPELGHGKFTKWLEENCVAEGASKQGAVRSIQKWMVLADYNKKYPQEIAECSSLKEAEQSCGVRPQPRILQPPDAKEPPANGNQEQVNMPELYLNEIRRSFEHIQHKYDQLTQIDPKLNRFLLEKGYHNDLPILLQEWQSSLNDALAYFDLPPVEPDVCVRCGHVRGWDEWFVPISAYYRLSHLQKWNQWCMECEAACDTAMPDVKELSANVEELKFLEVDEKQRAKRYTLAKKIEQLKTFTIDDPKLVTEANNNEWFIDLDNEESVIQTINTLAPKIVFAESVKEKQQWDIYRHFVSSAPYNQLVGRVIKFFVVDETSSKLLGIGAISSDFMTLDARDKFIGWSVEQRQEKGGRMGNIANGSVIVPTRFFGSNFLGGKLVAAVTTCEVIRNKWKDEYGDVLAAVSTTSLFGVPSMYDRIAQWKRLGLTTGRVPIEPSRELYEKWKQFLNETRTHEYKQLLKISTNQKTHVLNAIYKSAGISDYEHGHERGAYFSEIYENTKEFLCGKITEKELKIKTIHQASIGMITNTWRKKAIERYQSLKQKGELNKARQSYSTTLEMSNMETEE